MAERVSRELLERGLRQREWRVKIGLFGGLVAGLFLSIYTFWGGRTIYMEQSLSFNHKGLDQRCGNCHHAFHGVNDSRCAYPCHAGIKPTSAAAIPYMQEIHYVGNSFNNSDCLTCHPAECHTVSESDKQKRANNPLKSDMPCGPKVIENLMLPSPLTVNTCKSCHPDGCTRSVRCIDCHHEHLGGMPLAVNRPDEVFPGKFMFPAQLRKILEGDHQESSVDIVPVFPAASLIKTMDESVAINLESLAPKMPSGNCLACHPGVLTRTPPTPEDIKKTLISKSMFRHDSPGHRRYRSCAKCHRKAWLTEPDPEENIFTMEACSEKCHYPDDCSGCHKFHDRVAKPGEHTDIPAKLKYFLESAAATPEAVATPEKEH